MLNLMSHGSSSKVKVLQYDHILVLIAVEPLFVVAFHNIWLLIELLEAPSPRKVTLASARWSLDPDSSREW